MTLAYVDKGVVFRGKYKYMVKVYILKERKSNELSGRLPWAPMSKKRIPKPLYSPAPLLLVLVPCNARGGFEVRLHNSLAAAAQLWLTTGCIEGAGKHKRKKKLLLLAGWLAGDLLLLFLFYLRALTAKLGGGGGGGRRSRL